MRGPAGTGPAEEPLGQPGVGRCGPGQASRAPGRPGNGLERGGGGLPKPGLGVGVRPAEGRGREAWRALLASEGGQKPPRVPGAPAGAAWRARSGGGASPGSGGGATAAPPEAKFEKRTRFPPFFKPKNKTFFTIFLASLSPPGPSPLPTFPGGPRSARASRCNGGFALPPAPRRRIPGPLSRRLAPRCGRAAAPRASRGAPQADSAPCWRAPVSLRRQSRPASPPAGRSPGRARGLFSARLAGLSSHWREPRAAVDSAPLGSAPSSSPLLKRATPGCRLRPGQAPGVRAGLGGLCPRKCTRLGPALAGRGR